MATKKVILITGASSGMGKDFAMRLLQEGHTVIGAARRVEKMNDLQQQGMHTYKMDITIDEDIEHVVNDINEKFGGLDVLINNAGFGLYGAVEDIPIDEARYQFEVNVFGVANLTQKVLPIMRQQGSGKIINISSMGGKIYTPLGAWYHATKHALEAWSDALRFEVKDHGIDVVIIEPGLIRTEFADVLIEKMSERSGEGAYAQLADKVAKSTAQTYEDDGGSPPSVISDLIVKAVKARRPKTRYIGGQMARPLMIMRKFLPDRWFDFILSRAIG